MLTYLDKLYDVLSASEGKGYPLPAHIEDLISKLQGEIETYLDEQERLNTERSAGEEDVSSEPI